MRTSIEQRHGQVRRHQSGGGAGQREHEAQRDQAGARPGEGGQTNQGRHRRLDWPGGARCAASVFGLDRRAAAGTHGCHRRPVGAVPDGVPGRQFLRQPLRRRAVADGVAPMGQPSRGINQLQRTGTPMLNRAQTGCSPSPARSARPVSRRPSHLPGRGDPSARSGPSRSTAARSRSGSKHASSVSPASSWRAVSSRWLAGSVVQTSVDLFTECLRSPRSSLFSRDASGARVVRS